MRRFLATEYLGAVLLLAATVVALVWANSPWHAGYDALWHTAVELSIGSRSLELDLHEVVNDGLMTLFFFVVGLEIVRELVDGELKDRRAAALPAVAALGGMVVPAALFVALNLSTGTTHGWGIPMATDIAFSLGVVALLGSRLPSGVKVFLLTLAVVDDIGAIIVIGVVYSDAINMTFLLEALGVFLVILGLRFAGVTRLAVYVPLGCLLWFLMFESGVHATIAGVALGLITPARSIKSTRIAREWAADLDDEPSAADIDVMTTLAQSSVSMAERLEYRLHPYTSYLVIPLFALANAGVRLGLGAFDEPGPLAVGLGILVGLVVGKTIGIAGSSWIALRLGVGVLPSGMTMRHVVGVAAVAGVGFTVSLFIAELAFPGDPALIAAAKIGILTASVVAACLGAGLLFVSSRRPAPD
jgi:Na+:H+ antiporter, NhaA family